MKILVTGGAGFIGSHIVDKYVAHNHEVLVVDNLWEEGGGRKDNINSAARFFPLDIRSKEAAELIVAEKPEVVNLHAAQHSVKISTDKPILDAEVNIVGLINLLEACVEAGTRKVIFAGSAASYGSPEKLPLDESSIQLPMSPYGITKMAFEHYLRYYHVEKHLAYTIFRYSNIYGPRQDPNGEAGVIAIFANTILKRESVRIDWDGNQEKDYLYVSDVAEANNLALTLGDNEIFCLGSGRGTSVNELYRHLGAIVGYEVPIVRSPQRPGDIYQSFFDCAKAAKLLGWKPTISLEDGLRKTVASLVTVRK
jgi:UDP-glucose 4-epimerase